MSNTTHRASHRAKIANLANQLHRLALRGLTDEPNPVYGANAVEEVNAAIDALLAARVSLHNAATIMEKGNPR